MYIGEGASLNGPKKRNLVYQWRETPGETRKGVKYYIERNKLQGWTEIFRLISSNVKVDLSNVRERKFLEKLLIGVYYLENRRLKRRVGVIPDFLNQS